jgi:GTPase SAR1 family protein
MVIMIADPNNPRIKYKIVLLGDQHVGKTAIIDQFINKRFGLAYNVPPNPPRLPSASTSSSKTSQSTAATTGCSSGTLPDRKGSRV